MEGAKGGGGQHQGPLYFIVLFVLHGGRENGFLWKLGQEWTDENRMEEARGVERWRKAKGVTFADEEAAVYDCGDGEGEAFHGFMRR